MKPKLTNRVDFAFHALKAYFETNSSINSYNYMLLKTMRIYLVKYYEELKGISF